MLEARWPELWSQIGAPGPAAHEIVERRERTARIAGVQLSSAYDRRAEAELQAARVPAGAPRAACYGVGLGDLPRALLARPELRELLVVPLAPQVLRLALELEDQRDWLADPRVDLRLPELPAFAPFAVAPAELQLAGDAALPLRDALVAELDRPFVEANWAARSGEMAAQIEANTDLALADGDVAELFGVRPGAAIAVAAPGPTLSEAVGPLRRLKAGGGLVVAISTALQPLARGGLLPDYVVMIDGLSIDPLTPEQRAKFAGVPLVYAVEVQRATLESWPGPRFAAALERPRYDALLARKRLGALWTEGTVAHSAVDFAVRLGAAEVQLHGLDFGYPGGESHARQTPDWQPQRRTERGRTVLDGTGRRLASDANLITYLRDLEGYVARHPEVRFRKTGRRGAALTGVAWL